MSKVKHEDVAQITDLQGNILSDVQIARYILGDEKGATMWMSYAFMQEREHVLKQIK